MNHINQQIQQKESTKLSVRINNQPFQNNDQFKLKWNLNETMDWLDFMEEATPPLLPPIFTPN